MSFAIIPAVDLLGGLVVHARGRMDRSRYRPLHSSLCPDPDPASVAGALSRAAQSQILYVADLDSITGTGDNAAAILAMAEKHPRLDLWVDAGVDNHERLFGVRDICPGVVPVVGSESAGDPAWLVNRDDFILSLDFAAAEFIGDPRLLDHSESWPDRVIIMSMSRVGMDHGPDFERLRRLREHRPDVEYYVAGGVRSRHDLERLAREGARGALVASALHHGRL